MLINSPNISPPTLRAVRRNYPTMTKHYNNNIILARFLSPMFPYGHWIKPLSISTVAVFAFLNIRCLRYSELNRTCLFDIQMILQWITILL